MVRAQDPVAGLKTKAALLIVSQDLLKAYPQESSSPDDEMVFDRWSSFLVELENEMAVVSERSMLHQLGSYLVRRGPSSVLQS